MKHLKLNIIDNLLEDPNINRHTSLKEVEFLIIKKPKSNNQSNNNNSVLSLNQSNNNNTVSSINQSNNNNNTVSSINNQLNNNSVLSINQLNNNSNSVLSINNQLNSQYLEEISPHLCYILYSTVSNRIYIGYTNNFPRRSRQHNGEIKGGAKKTRRFRPWKPLCTIHGFYDNSSALRFEWRLQHPIKKRRSQESALIHVITTLKSVIISGDGSQSANNKMPWPRLLLKWHLPNFQIELPQVINQQI